MLAVKGEIVMSPELDKVSCRRWFVSKLNTASPKALAMRSVIGHFIAFNRVDIDSHPTTVRCQFWQAAVAIALSLGINFVWCCGILLFSLNGEILQVYSQLLVNQVPGEWLRRGFASLKPLASWMEDLRWRVRFFEMWLERGNPYAFSLPAFFFPQVFYRLRAWPQLCIRPHLACSQEAHT